MKEVAMSPGVGWGSWLGLMAGAVTSGLLPDHLSWVEGG